MEERPYCYREIEIEDVPIRPSVFSILKAIFFQCVTTTLWIPISLVCVPLYLLGLLIWGRPPVIPSWSRFCRYLTATWKEGKPEDGIAFTNRILIFLIVFDILIKSPINGVSWFLDELLYHSYHKTDIRDPVFIISGTRSGSTQITDYLEGHDKENFISPMVIEALFPYIWVWRLVLPGMKMLGYDKRLEASGFGEEARKRHNFDLYKSDTWEVLLGSGHLLTFLCQYFGCSFFKWGFFICNLQNYPVDQEFIKCFVELNDCVIKKVMYYRASPQQRVMIKGHFLFAAKTLQNKYQGSKFITIVRNPISRMQSVVNWLQVISCDGPPHKLYGMYPFTWRVVRDWSIEMEVSYCEEERLFYTQSEGYSNNKLAISFTSYVNDLTSTLQNIYSFLNISLPAEMFSKASTLQSTTHNRTKRKSTYDPKYNRSLSSLGVDEEKLGEYFINYINWIKELDKMN